MKTAVIIAFDKVTGIDVHLPWDLLNRARLRHKDFRVKILGTEPAHASSCGLSITTHGSIEEANQADWVLFASGQGTRSLYQNTEYLERFRLNPEQQLISSICSGSLILAGLGLLNNITATTYPTAADELRNMGVTVVEDQHLVTHGNIATAAGCLAAVSLAGWGIERLFDEATKNAVVASVQPAGQGLVCMY